MNNFKQVQMPALPVRSLGHTVTLALLFFAFAALCIFSTDAYAAKKKTDKLCYSCHNDARAIARKKVVHKPVKDGKCTECHSAHASKHDKLINKGGAALCYKCHDKKDYEGEVVHMPVVEGRCDACHDPHSSENANLMPSKINELCFSCHKREDIDKGKDKHPEFAKGRCLSCHNVHASGEKALLVKAPEKLCESCHDKPGSKYARAHTGYKVSGTDCLSCHAAHSSESKAIIGRVQHAPFKSNKCSECHKPGSNALKSNSTELCLRCHEDAVQSFSKIYTHLYQSEGTNLCITCHSPHASDRDTLIKDRQDRLCYTCHADTREYAARSNYVHEKLSECGSCHVAHGSNERYMLVKGDNTCSTFECHSTQGSFTHPVGADIIDPRTKLHMNCSTCHNPMGSPVDSILRDSGDMDLCVQCHVELGG